MKRTVIDILMERDKVTREEAQHTLDVVRAEVEDAIAVGDYDEVEEIIASELGLEMDYIDEILF